LPAIAAAHRLIREALFGKKLLFSHRKEKLAAAIFAAQHLIFQRNVPPE
jgi:hypothetical protein